MMMTCSNHLNRCAFQNADTSDFLFFRSCWVRFSQKRSEKGGVILGFRGGNRKNPGGGKNPSFAGGWTPPKRGVQPLFDIVTSDDIFTHFNPSENAPLPRTFSRPFPYIPPPFSPEQNLHFCVQKVALFC